MADGAQPLKPSTKPQAAAAQSTHPGVNNAVQPELATNPAMGASGQVLMGSAIGAAAAAIFAVFLWLGVH